MTLEPGAPSAPSTLCREAKAEWNRIVPELNRTGLLAKVDRGALAAYCDAWAKWNEARRLLDAEGLTCESGRDNRPAKHPAWMVYAQAATLMAAFEKELFISPNARLRSALPEADDGEAESGVLD